MSDMRMAKYETLIEDIDSKIKKRIKDWKMFVRRNTALAWTMFYMPKMQN